MHTVEINNEAKKKRVLVVDDDVCTTDVIKFMVEQGGHAECDTATDPYEALNMLCDNFYDLLMIDQRIPGICGTSILKKLDEQINLDPLCQEQFADALPTILMSGAPISLADDYELEHFAVKRMMNKKDLPHFIFSNFTY